MNFNQMFNQTNLKQRLGNFHPLLSLLLVIGISLTSLVLLPFLLMFALVSFIGLNLLGRKYLAPRMQPIFSQQSQANEFYRSNPNMQRESSIYKSEMFRKAKPSNTGRTFEHNPD
ncbi:MULTISPECIES: hypothetical protein [unclassified Shewanella]|uniref:hypothetical protein n=1 Tax=unclassified Shewanella TaxID=196818 RepID=UPI000C81C76C|nr:MULTISPECIES: hypothetical protein [unclassified Shewanella]MDO6618425.1 hypothetical protein [Shewanella sp. 6_MG-2023]MDO6640247.1 hypothetical protein [Shewanella sp. 5_MG-2023]MDO6679674.1 hypothetical protein [Shewanella sp. 4_MG-2023]MDO6774441.1 hypothetical protein [Shewanella sp. 3_MG-2023]PMG28911.1 hypothetical protein BCU94_03440 [Shewanella sp. 10N.286.52.C2]